jgi:hypothetical protein
MVFERKNSAFARSCAKSSAAVVAVFVQLVHAMSIGF